MAVVDMGTISARGQVAIPARIRKELDLKEGERVLFVAENGNLTVKRLSDLPWDELTRPLREAAAKANLTEEDIQEAVRAARKSSSIRIP